MKTQLILFLLLLSYYGVMGQGLQLLPGATFHDAVWDSEFGELEDTATPDEGGLLYLVVQNTTNTTLGIADVQVQDLQGAPQTFDGWYAWPDTLAAGGMTTLFVKAINAPLAEGEDVRVVVTTSDNATHTYDLTDLTTPELRLANAIPSHDRSALWIYLRNDGNAALELDSLYLNEQAFSIQATGQFVTLHGSNVIQPNETRIINVQYGLDLSDLATYAIRVRYNTTQWVSASIRITPPEYPIGSWSSSGADPENEFGRKRMRKVGVEMLQGLGNYSYIANANQEYFIRAIREPHFGDPFDPNIAIPEVQAQANNSDIIVWTVDDEPDLNGKPIDQQLAKAATYRNNDDDTPIHINLAVQKKFQRYGWYSDIVSMDHYAAPSAPNVIPLTYIPFVGRMSEIEEAYAYSHQLKMNTEPRRMWSWVQFAASTWDVQPEPIAINYQFWAHVAAGAKGMEYFVAQSQTQDDFPELWNEGLRLFKEFKQVRNACLYGEPSAVVSASNPDVLTYALLGPQAMVVIALNNSVSFSGNQVTGFATDHSPQTYTATISYPDWFAFGEVYAVTPEGKVPVDHTINAAMHQIQLFPEQIDDRAQVFIISQVDDEPPLMPEGLNVAEYVDSLNYTLSWKEPYDNMGVKGYKVHYNGVLVADVAAPLFEVEGQSIACSGYYRITPYDNAGNLGQPDSVQFILNGNEPEITEQAEIDTDGFNYIISVSTSGVCGIQWQWRDVLSDYEWADIDAQDGIFIGYQSEELIISYEDFGNLHADLFLRAVITCPCVDTLTSNEVGIPSASVASYETTDLRVFPNPTRDLVRIMLPEGCSGGSISVYNATGSVVMVNQIDAGADQHAISMEELANGLYVVRYADRDGVIRALSQVVKR